MYVRDRRLTQRSCLKFEVFLLAENASLANSLAELRRLTGLDLRLADDSDTDEETGERLRMLVGAYREKYDRGSFVRSLLRGEIPEADLYTRAAHFHLQEDGRWILYVIECESGVEDAAKVMKHLFVTQSSDLLVTLDSHRLALLKTARSKMKPGLEAHTIVDMLNTEAMIAARVGFEPVPRALADMPRACREAGLSLEIGRIFYGNETVLQYSKLGIGRLIHDLPDETCRLFLSEVFGDGSPDDFDDETVAIINAFFVYILNISETARQLYVHRNTLVYRLEKLRQATGLDLRVFDDAVELKLAMMVNACMKEREAKRKN